jgi:nucleoside-diphosphate-sugar epimerase
MVEGAVRGERVYYDHGRDIPRDYTHVVDITGVAVAALNTPRDRLEQRAFYAATGRPLVTAGQVAEIVKEKIPSADVRIESGLSFADTLEIKFRGVLDMAPTHEQLGYQFEYADVRNGIDQLIDQYSRYLASTGKTPAKRA